MATTLNASTSSGLVQSADTSGTLELQSNGTTQLTVSSTGVAVTSITGAITSGTAQTLTSQTSIDFTSIPSWSKKITVMFAGVSTSGTSIMQVQLGDNGGFETSGYVGSTTRIDSSIGNTTYSAGYLMSNQAITAASTYSGSWVLTKIDGNTWVENHMITETGDATSVGGGYKALSDTLTQVRITTVNGTDTFDAGTINIQYEG